MPLLSSLKPQQSASACLPPTGAIYWFQVRVLFYGCPDRHYRLVHLSSNVLIIHLLFLAPSLFPQFFSSQLLFFDRLISLRYLALANHLGQALP